MHRVRWSAVLAVLVLMASVDLVGAPRAVAECSFLDPWPQMRYAAPSARRVVIGTVRDVEVERRRPGDEREVRGFTLEVTEDVKGSGPSSIRLPGVATDYGCIGSRLWVRNGERIAVAFGGRGKGIAGPVSAVAFMGDEPGRLRGRPNHVMYRACPDIFTDCGIFTNSVKNHTSVNNESLAAWAVALLRALPGAPVVGTAPHGSADDASVQFPDAGLVLRVEQKAHVDPVIAHSIGDRNSSRPEPLLVVARTTTAVAREILESSGIGYVDAAGNAAIDLPGLHVRTGSLARSGSFAASAVIAPAKYRPVSPRLAGKAGLIAQALILEPGRAWRLDAMAERAGVSTALAHRVFSRLERETVLVADGRGPRKTRRVASPGALLDLWAEEGVEPKERRTPAYALVRGDGTRELSSRLGRSDLAHAVTGVAAAVRRVAFLTSVLVIEIRVEAARMLDEVAAAAGARLVEDGANIVFVQGADDAELRFRRKVEGVWLAAETRVYLDALRDPRRGAEQAREYRSQVFGF